MQIWHFALLIDEFHDPVEAESDCLAVLTCENPPRAHKLGQFASIQRLPRPATAAGQTMSECSSTKVTSLYMFQTSLVHLTSTIRSSKVHTLQSTHSDSIFNLRSIYLHSTLNNKILFLSRFSLVKSLFLFWAPLAFRWWVVQFCRWTQRYRQQPEQQFEVIQKCSRSV